MKDILHINLVLIHHGGVYTGLLTLGFQKQPPAVLCSLECHSCYYCCHFVRVVLFQLELNLRSCSSHSEQFVGNSLHSVEAINPPIVIKAHLKERECLVTISVISDFFSLSLIPGITHCLSPTK